MFRLTVFACLLGVSTGALYNYVDQSTWGGACNKADSKKQSPVDVKTPDKYQVLEEGKNVIELPDSTAKVELKRKSDENTMNWDFKTNFEIQVPAMPNADVKGTSHSFHVHW